MLFSSLVCALIHTIMIDVHAVPPKNVKMASPGATIYANADANQNPVKITNFSINKNANA